jgi:two-component system sensor histidine kinase YesM
MKTLTAEERHPDRRRYRSLNARQFFLFAAIVFLTVLVAAGIGWLVSEQNAVFSDFLETYLAIHRFRVILSQSEDAMDRYLRDRTDPDLVTYRRLVPGIWELHSTLNRSRTDELEDYFQLRAIQFGLLAYFEAMDRAAVAADVGASDAYNHFVYGARIRSYIDGYAQLLLQVRLDVGEAYARALASRANAVTIGAGSAIALLIVLMLGFAVAFSRTVTRPIVLLAQSAHEIAEGNLDAPIIRTTTRDEIGTLAEAFLRMQRNIKELIHDVQDKHELEVRAARLSQSLREAQLLGLQSQINPHFLFNTLNTISRTALFEGATETTDLIQSLAHVFRYMLQEPHTTVTLEDELKIVEEYVTLQRHRFHERLGFSLNCEIDARSVSIPALTIQPLVENAIRHGIEPREEGGAVSVHCMLVDSHVVIKVADTGVGMDSVGAALDESSDQIGLRNVKARLELLHGEALCFDIESTPGRGTVISIRFPAQ